MIKMDKTINIFFPDRTAIFYEDEYVGNIDITRPLGFSMICFNKYKCG